MPTRTYTHLLKEERDLIAVLRGEGRSLRSIARELGRDPGTLSRELKRNAPPIHRGHYLPHKAQERAENRNRESHRRDRLKDPCVRRYAAKGIRLGWSPETVAGRWSRLHPELPVSHEAVYQWVHADRQDLTSCLLRAHKKRRRRGEGKRHKTIHIPNRIPVSERPKEAQTRRVAGHWETDTVISRQSKAALQVSVERKTRYTRLAKISTKSARQMSMALNRRLSKVPRRLRKTITYDNGSENVEHERTNKVLGTQSFFCEPYHSWEKGTVENTIGVVRRSLPKKTDFATVSSKDLRRLERWMNNRPRKCLKYQTSAEAWKDECCT